MGASGARQPIRSRWRTATAAAHRRPSREAFQTIDAKATGLLTHVSMMIAGLGICAPLLAQHPVEEAIIIIEISVYLLIAVGCLRCLSVVRSVNTAGDAAATKHHSAANWSIRHELYRWCNRLSIIFTMLVFLSLPIMLWWKPDCRRR